MADSLHSSRPRPLQTNENSHAKENGSRLPIRPAPAPPLPTNAKTNKEPFLRSDTSKTQDKNSNERSSKKMFLFKKHKENSNPSSSNNNESKPTTTENKKKVKWHTPTIIRPVPASTAKKKLPPRPPPPKASSGNGVISVFPLDPPSYEEVLRADTSAHYTQAGIKKPSTKPRAPSVPVTDPFDMWPVENTSSLNNDIDLLIDFTSPQTCERLERKTSLPNDLLELDEIFSNPTSSGSLGNAPMSTSHNTQASKPVPKPRLSLTRSFSLDNKTVQYNCRSEADGPALPPRPDLTAQETVDFISTNSFDSVQPPALPPRPKNYTDDSQETDVLKSVSWQRSEPHGIAMYDYKATQSDDLSFKVSDTITLIHRIDNEWLYGCLGDREGMFPRSFVQIIIPLPDDPEFQEGIPPVSGPRCLALYDFFSECDDELSFRVGDMLRLIARVNEYWLKGMVEDRIGLVPTNFVRIIEDLH